MKNVSADMAEFLVTFFEEAEEHLGTMETALVGLGTKADSNHNNELLNQVFRAAHSIKGASGAFGFNEIMRFTHAMEWLLDQLREGSKALTDPVTDLLLRANDVLKELIASLKSDGEIPSRYHGVFRELEEAVAITGAVEGEPESFVESTAEIANPGTEYRVRFVPAPQLFETGMDPVVLFSELAQLGELIEVTPDLSRLPDLFTMNPVQCYLEWSLSIRTERPASDVLDVFAFVEDFSVVEVTVAPDGAAEAAVLSEQLSEPVSLPTAAAHAEASVESVAKRPTMNVAANATKRSTLAAPAKETKNIAAKTMAGGQGSTLRVATESIDKLLNLVGELVIAQSMISEAIKDTSPAGRVRLHDAVAEMERSTRELQERVMAVRMVPIGSVFKRFPRVVRDVSSSLNKKIKLVIEGEETEIDKGMVEQIVDPLTHLIRNAIDHGIEPTSERQNVNKPEEGLIRLSAYHEGGNVVIEVVDDGRGLQLDRIREKAISRGLLSPNDQPTEEQLHALIFAAGFSTADAVSDLSGRGVGMDVVKRNVEDLSGSLTFTSKAGSGSKIQIRLPLTLAILDGLTLRMGTQLFVLPLTSVVESIRPKADQVRSVMGGKGEFIRVRGDSLPLVRLHQVMNIDGCVTDPCKALITIVEANHTRFGVLVDEVVGQAQVVVKPLEANYRRIDGLMGATIMGDGRVALILDVQCLARKSDSASIARAAAAANPSKNTVKRAERKGDANGSSDSVA